MPRGMPARSPWTIYIKSQVENGPLPYLRLIHEAAALVPPGRGFRRGTSLHEAVDRTRGKVTPAGTVDATIRRGQKSIALNSIRQMVKTGKLVVYFDDDGTKMVGRGPKA